MKKLLIIALLAFFANGTVSYGQTYSLQDVVQIVLKNNKEIVNGMLDVSATDYKIKEVKSALLPNAEFNGKSMYYKDLPAQYVPSSTFGGPEGTYSKVSLNMKQNTSATFQVTQNLFNKSVLIGLKSAKTAHQASQLSEKMTEENVVYEVMSTYYSVQVYQDNLDRLNANIANLEKTVEINDVLRKNELVADNVHRRMLVNLESLRNEREIQTLQLQQYITYLKYLMDKPIEEELTVMPFDYSKELKIFDPADISERSDLRLQKAQVDLAKYDEKLVKSGFYPVLTSFYSVGYTGFYDEFAPFKQINDDWVKNSYFGLNLQVPLFDGFKKRNQIHQKKIEVQKNTNLLAMMELKANKELRDAQFNLSTNKNLFINNQRSLELAESLFASAQGEYEGGLTSVTDLLNAQNDLSNARNNYSAALLNLKLAELAVLKANGTLLSNIEQ
ncbi:MAG: TolC family protein [Allomuricauda sp.]